MQLFILPLCTGPCQPVHGFSWCTNNVYLKSFEASTTHRHLHATPCSLSLHPRNPFAMFYSFLATQSAYSSSAGSQSSRHAIIVPSPYASLTHFYWIRDGDDLPSFRHSIGVLPSCAGPNPPSHGFSRGRNNVAFEYSEVSVTSRLRGVIVISSRSHCPASVCATYSLLLNTRRRWFTLFPSLNWRPSSQFDWRPSSVCGAHPPTHGFSRRSNNVYLEYSEASVPFRHT